MKLAQIQVSAFRKTCCSTLFELYMLSCRALQVVDLCKDDLHSLLRIWCRNIEHLDATEKRGRNSVKIIRCEHYDHSARIKFHAKERVVERSCRIGFEEIEQYRNDRVVGTASDFVYFVKYQYRSCRISFGKDFEYQPGSSLAPSTVPAHELEAHRSVI